MGNHFLQERVPHTLLKEFLSCSVAVPWIIAQGVGCDSVNEMPGARHVLGALHADWKSTPDFDPEGAGRLPLAPAGGAGHFALEVFPIAFRQLQPLGLAVVRAVDLDFHSLCTPNLTRSMGCLV